MKMRINLNQASTTIRIPFFALFSAIFDFKDKSITPNNAQESEYIESSENSEERSSDENISKPKKFKLNISPIKNSFKKINFGKVKEVKVKAKKHPKISLAILVLLLLIGLVAFKVSEPSKTASDSLNKNIASENTATKINVNKRFEVPIKNKDGSDTGEKLAITIANIEKTHDILIKNSPAKTKNGKIFLVLNIEIQNDTKKQLTVRPVDMVRLIGDDGRSYAPEVHNNEVSAEPVSLRKTKVGYVVDENKNSFKLQIGEVRGQQEAIEVVF